MIQYNLCLNCQFQNTKIKVLIVKESYKFAYGMKQADMAILLEQARIYIKFLEQQIKVYFFALKLLKD